MEFEKKSWQIPYARTKNSSQPKYLGKMIFQIFLYPFHNQLASRPGSRTDKKLFMNIALDILFPIKIIILYVQPS